MRYPAVFLFFLFVFSSGHSAEKPQALPLTCEDYSWSDVEILVQPYLDDVLHTALVMQGQSSGYITSEAARQAMGESLPDGLKRLLQALIDAEC